MAEVPKIPNKFPNSAVGGGDEHVLWTIIHALNKIIGKRISLKLIVYTINEPPKTEKENQS